MKKIFLILPLFASLFLFLFGCGAKSPATNCDTNTSNVCPLPTTSGQQNILTGVTP